MRRRLSLWVIRAFFYCVGHEWQAIRADLYAQGFAAGRAAERADLLQDFAVLEQDAPPRLH